MRRIRQLVRRCSIWTNLERGLNLEEGAVGRIALTRDRDLTHPQQESAHSSWGAKGSHVVGHAFSDEHDLWVLLQGAPFVLTKQCTGDSG